MTLKEIKEMINLMEEHSLAELEVEKDGLKIKLKREASGKIVTQTVGMVPQILQAPAALPASIQGAPVAQQTGRDTVEAANIVTVRSPMVGTFYTAAAPDATPYVTKNKKIAAGDVLCIIEAMKLMNEIKSDLGGTLLEILVENGQPVEFDQPLFKIQKS